MGKRIKDAFEKVAYAGLKAKAAERRKAGIPSPPRSVPGRKQKITVRLAPPIRSISAIVRLAKN